MIEWLAKPPVIAALLALVALNLLMLFYTSLFLLVSIIRQQGRTPKAASNLMQTGTGTFCGHCGNRMTNDPVRAVAVSGLGFFVYKCPACDGETLLPSQSD